MEIPEWLKWKYASNKYLDSEDLKSASECLGKAIQMVPMTEHDDAALMLSSLAGIYIKMAQYVLAERAIRRAISIETEFGPPTLESPRLGSYEITLARALEKQGKLDEALEHIENSLAVYLLHIGEDEDFIVNIKAFRESVRRGKGGH